LSALTSPQNVTKPEVTTSKWNTDWVAVERPYAVRKTVDAPVLSYNDESQYFGNKDEFEVSILQWKLLQKARSFSENEFCKMV